MPKVAVYNMSGKPVSEIELSDLVFGAQIHEHAIHSVVRAQLNAKRQGTQAAKTRTEVRGGGPRSIASRAPVMRAIMAAGRRSSRMAAWCSLPSRAAIASTFPRRFAASPCAARSRARLWTTT